MIEPPPLRVLIVEDNQDDVLSMLTAIERWGYVVILQVASSAEEFRTTLASGEAFDVIIADYALSDFSAVAAYDMLQAENNRTPFIMVTGTEDDEACLALMDRGAADYLRKDRIRRLGPAVEKAMEHYKLLTRTELGLQISDAFTNRLDRIIRESEEMLQDLKAHRERGWKSRG